MNADQKLIQGIEEKLQELNLGPEEEDKKRKFLYKQLGLEQSGFKSKDLELPDGSILIGVSKGELRQAIARDGSLWVDGEAFSSISTAAAKATANPTQYGWAFWTMCYVPKRGFIETKDLRDSEIRAYGKRS